MKKRLTLLLTDEQIRAIKVQAAQAGLPANQWIIDQLDLADTPTAFAKQVPDVEDVSAEYLTAYGQTGRNDTALGDQDPVHIADDTPQEAQDTAKADTTPHVDPDHPQPDDDTAIDAQGDLEKTEAELIRERDLKLVEIADQYPGPGNAQKKVDALNDSGVLLKGVTGQWTKRNASNNVRLARERLAKK